MDRRPGAPDFIALVALVAACFVKTSSAQGEAYPEKVAHAALGSTAWVAVFAIGAILRRVLHGPRTWLVHASIQAIGIALVTAGAGNGIYLAIVTDQLNTYHAIIGLVLFGLVYFLAIGGLLAHCLSAKQQGKRNVIGYIHAWLGRALITLGMIQGGLGLLLSDDASRGEYIAYGIIAALFWLAFIGNAAWFETANAKEHTSTVGKPE